MSISSFLYKKAIIKRYDDNHIIHYFSYKDFPSLKARPISFKTEQGNLIKGNIYSYDNANKEDLIIFCHGIGAGHRSYMREIEVLAKNGYEVLSYDNTGCFDSEGENIRSLSESTNVLVSCMSFIENSKDLKDRQISLVGHSWGGFAVGSALKLYNNIKSAVIISTFDSIEVLLDKIANGRLKIFKKGILKYERDMNPKYYFLSLSNALNKTNAKVLVLQSKDDNILNIDVGLSYMKEHVKNDNVTFLEVDKKLHNPNYTIDAVNYLSQTFSLYNKLIKEKKLKTFDQKKAFMDEKDFWKMTEQDEVIWEKILNALA